MRAMKRIWILLWRLQVCNNNDAGAGSLCVSIFLKFMMNTSSKIMVWNCRGAANTSFYRYCKHYVNDNKPIMVVIVETRCDPNKLRRTFKLLVMMSLLLQRFKVMQVVL
jgi:hypothetical protein